MLTRRSFHLLWGAALAPTSTAAVKVAGVRRIFHNGEHNAFTDLARFRGRLYLTFRSCPDGHMVHPTSSIVVMASDDEGQNWRQIHRFSVPKRDVRDPHFLEFRNQLFIYTGTWYCGDSSPEILEMNRHLGFAAWTSDGETWQGPQALEGTYGHYIWRAAQHGGRAYLCGRRKRDFAATSTREEARPITESAMLESDDGLRWKTAGLFQAEWGNETAFQFASDGSVVAVARGGGERNAELCRSRPPYTDWTREDLGRYIGGPLLTMWNGRFLVGGRRKLTGESAVTALYWLDGDQLEEFATLPSGGDNSYPGFVALDSRRGLVSYYSTHEKDAAGKPITAIYLAELSSASRGGA